MSDKNQVLLDELNSLISKLSHISGQEISSFQDEDNTLHTDYEKYGTGPDGIGIDVKKANIFDTVNNTIEFWNQSVIDAITNFKKELNGFKRNNAFIDEFGNPVLKDAANSFTAGTHYVLPWETPYPIPEYENYLEARQDPIESVLTNNKELRYTINNENASVDSLLKPQLENAVDFIYICENKDEVNKYYKVIPPQFASSDSIFTAEEVIGDAIEEVIPKVKKYYYPFKKGLNYELVKLSENAVGFKDPLTSNVDLKEYINLKNVIFKTILKVNELDEGEEAYIQVKPNPYYLEGEIWLDYQLLPQYEEVSLILQSLTRLIMPKYSRRVEIEDLNRNFWVISHNLTLLNRYLLTLGDTFKDVIGDIFGELMGLWENVYRIWQAIMWILQEIGKLGEDVTEIANVAAKTKVKLAYGGTFDQQQAFWSNPEVASRLFKTKNNGKEWETINIDGIDYLHLIEEDITFKPGDAKYFGIYPLLEKEDIVYKDNDGQKVGTVCYLPYNKTICSERINKLSEKELEDIFVNGRNSQGEIVRIERHFGNTPISSILEDVRKQNYVLVSNFYEHENVLIDNLKIIHDPILNFLQFFRDVYCSVFKVTIPESNGTKDLGTIQNDSFAYLQFTTPSVYREKDYFPTSIWDSINFLKDRGFLAINNFEFLIEKPNTIEDFMNKLGIKEIESYRNCFYAIFLDFIKKITKKEEGSGDNGLGTVNSKVGVDKYSDQKNIELTDNLQESYIEQIKNTYYPYFQNEWTTDDSFSSTIILTGLLPIINLFSYYLKDYISDESGRIVTCSPYYLLCYHSGLFLPDGNDYVELAAPDGTGEKKRYKISDSDSDYEIYGSSNIIKWDLISSCLEKGNFEFQNTYDDPNQGVFSQDLANNMATVFADILNECGWYQQGIPNRFGNSYLYPYEGTMPTGYWFDFVQEPSGNGYSVMGGNVLSFTCNHYNGAYGFSHGGDDFISQGTIWKYKNIYNTDIAITFIGAKNQKYHDFIRYNKPYPSLTKLIETRKIQGESYNHLIALNGTISDNNYLYYYKEETQESNKIKITKKVIDGFIGWDNALRYPIEQTIDEIPYKVAVQYDNDNHQYQIIREERKRINAKNGNMFDYYGGIYGNNHLFTLTSTDLINAHANNIEIKEGRTEWHNYNIVENPAVMLSYISSDTASQQLSLFISKDTTENDIWRTEDIIDITSEVVEPPIAVNYSDLHVVCIGDFYNLFSKYTSQDIINGLISVQQPEEQHISFANKNLYTTDYCGENSYFWRGTEQIGISANEHDYLDTASTDNIFISYNENGKDNIFTPYIQSATLDLKSIGQKVLEKIYPQFLSSESVIYVITKVGCGNWFSDTGTSEDENTGGKWHSRWSGGALCDLFKITNTGDITHICSINRKEGYWGRNVFKDINVIRHRMFTTVKEETVGEERLVGYIQYFDANEPRIIKKENITTGNNTTEEVDYFKELKRISGGRPRRQLLEQNNKIFEELYDIVKNMTDVQNPSLEEHKKFNETFKKLFQNGVSEFKFHRLVAYTTFEVNSERNKIDIYRDKENINNPGGYHYREPNKTFGTSEEREWRDGFNGERLQSGLLDNFLAPRKYIGWQDLSKISDTE